MSIRWLHLLTLSHSLTHFNSNCVSLSISVMLKIFSHLSSRSFHNRLDMHHSLFHSWTLFPFIFHTLAIQQQTPSLTLSIYISQSIILSLSTYFIHSTALCFFLSLSLSLSFSLSISFTFSPTPDLSWMQTLDRVISLKRHLIFVCTGRSNAITANKYLVHRNHKVRSCHRRYGDYILRNCRTQWFFENTSYPSGYNWGHLPILVDPHLSQYHAGLQCLRPVLARVIENWWLYYKKSLRWKYGLKISLIKGIVDGISL